MVGCLPCFSVLHCNMAAVQVACLTIPMNYSVFTTCLTKFYLQKWSTTIKDFFTFKSTGRSKQTSETVVIVDSTKDSLVYSLYLNGKPVYSKDMSLKTKNGQIVSYTFMSWTMLDRKSEMIMTGLGLLCFVFGVILLISPCFEDGEDGEKGADTCVSVKVQKSEKQNIDGYTVDEMRKSLLEDYQLL